MASILDIERAAARLRNQIRLATLPELKLLCGLRFFAQFAPDQTAGLESYVREFVPALAQSAKKSNPRELLPEEFAALGKLIASVEPHAAAVQQDDLAALHALHDACARGTIQERVVSPQQIGGPPTPLPLGEGAQRAGEGKRRATTSAAVTCLFVEYYPDLDLPPRGRCLTLNVTATPISNKVEADDIVVRNPVSEPDDRFLSQARESVAAARAHLARRYGQSLRKRYRFDFAVESTGARFTGDSLGVAFAVGAMAAIGRVEVFREKISLRTDVAFSGALSADGRLAPIDADALKLKIYRAFHSGLRFLVLPRAHITDAWAYLKELETTVALSGDEGRHLELVGADHLDAVATDPRLLPTERSSAPAYAARKAWKAKRSAWVEVPVFVALLVALAFIILPRYVIRNPTSVRLTAKGFEALNSWHRSVWSKAFPCDSIEDAECSAVYDLDGDGHNEVLFMPQTRSMCSSTAKLHVYSWKGTLLFTRECVNWGAYPEADSGQKFQVQHLHVVKVRGEPVIITDTHRSDPSQAHLRMWDRLGNLKGWYINAGAAHFQFARDWNGDGREDLFFKGNQIRMDGSTIFILRADSSVGVSPPYEDADYDLAGVMPGNQLHYMVFPRSQVAKALDFPYASPGSVIVTSDSTFEASVGQSRIRNVDGVEVTGYLTYYMNAKLRTHRVDLEDTFKAHRAKAIAKGLLPEQSLDDFKAETRDAVIYWTDSGWVTEGQLRAAGK